MVRVTKVEPEKLFYSKLTEEQRKEFERTGSIIWNNKNEIELSRYKQDCRKRALEMAAASLNEGRKANTLAYNDGKPEDAQLIDLADKYYKWLISIPE